MEGRGRLEGSPCGGARDRTQSRVSLTAPLARVNEAAARDKQTRFTALLHHVTTDALERAFCRLRRSAAEGIDGTTVAAYEQDLMVNIEDLHQRVHTGRYRPKAVRRVYIPKADGCQRPLGIPALEDKIVQGAVAEVLNAVYETDFMGFSYGFRPGRGPHDALEAVHTAVMSQRVNWVLDADIRSFFDSVDHEWMLRMLAHRIADPRILRLVRGWMRAGVLEKKEWKQRREGRGGNQPAPREHLSALRTRSLGPSMASSACTGTSGRHPVCRRLRDGLPVRGRRQEDANCSGGATYEIFAGHPPGQDAPHGVW